MKININVRGNGACPLCRKENNCIIRLQLGGSVKELGDDDGDSMDIVIYKCSLFVEKNS